MRYEAAGDQHVGRVVSGLPVNSADFATLPPHFNVVDTVVLDAIAECFPGLPSDLNLITQFCLASLVYHHDFLERTLPPTHLALQSPLFRNRDKLSALYTRVVCRVGTPEDRITATGLPAYVSLMSDVASLQREVRTLRQGVMSNLESMPDRIITGVVSGVEHVIEERAFNSGTVTQHGVSTVVQSALAPIRELMEEMRAQRFATQQPAPPAPPPPPPPSSGMTPAYTWKGGFHLLPEGFQVPMCNVAMAWQHYCCGNSTTPALRNVHPNDFSDGNARKRFSEFKSLMVALEKAATDSGRWIAHPTIAQANEIFAAAAPSVLEVPLTTTKQRSRRVEQMKWSSVVTVLRKSRAPATSSDS